MTSRDTTPLSTEEANRLIKLCINAHVNLTVPVFSMGTLLLIEQAEAYMISRGKILPGTSILKLVIFFSHCHPSDLVS